MFNRKIEMKVVKHKKDTAVPNEDNVVPVKFVYANAAMNNLIYDIGKAVVVYMLLDTFRQVMVERAKKL
jgi:hypothetical protein